MKTVEDLKKDLETQNNEVLDKLKQAKASYDKPSQNVTMDDVCAALNSLHQAHSRMWDHVYASQNALYSYQDEHSKGHLPPIKTASAMEKALKMCGMENDYAVYKPTISVAKTSRGSVISVE